MKKGEYSDPNVQCPFYDVEERQKVICEGVPDSARLHVTFKTDDQKRCYKGRYCKKDWRRCMIAHMLEEKYE